MKLIRNLKLAFSFLACTTLLVLSPQAQLPPVTNSVGGTIFLDYNINDVPDTGEGASGVGVTLYASNGLSVLDTTTTDANGVYRFSELTTGTYWVAVDTNTLPGTPGQWTNTVDPDGVTPLNWAMVTFPHSPSNGQSAVSLGTAEPFAVLAGTTITSTGGHRDRWRPRLGSGNGGDGISAGDRDQRNAIRC
jgi:hypothetical protein